jgi:hypothetical protein
MRVFVTKKASESRRQLNTRQAGKHAKFSAKISLKSPIPQGATIDRRGVAAGTASGAAQRWLRVVQTVSSGINASRHHANRFSAQHRRRGADLFITVAFKRGKNAPFETCANCGKESTMSTSIRNRLSATS